MLSTMNPSHRFFAKDWIKPKVIRMQGASDSSFVSNPGGFWDGLPTASKQKKHGKGINFSDSQSIE